MKRTSWILALVGAVLLSTAPVLADGDIYVVVGSGVGTRISSLPCEIKTPGFYYLAGNLNAASGNGITISSGGVTLDLMGFSLSGNSGSDGIAGAGEGVEVRNGTVSGWNHGVNLSGFGIRVINLRALGNTFGIFLTGSDHLVKGCVAKDNTNTGINAFGSLISGNLVSSSSSGTNGISGYGTISGNRVSGAYTTAIYCNDSSNVIGNTVFSTGTTGIKLPSAPVVMDQNTVLGGVTPYDGGTTLTVWAGKSTDNPWGSNAGHQP